MPEVKYEGQLDGHMSSFAKMFEDFQCPKCHKKKAIPNSLTIKIDPQWKEKCKYCNESFSYEQIQSSLN